MYISLFASYVIRMKIVIVYQVVIFDKDHLYLTIVHRTIYMYINIFINRLILASHVLTQIL